MSEASRAGLRQNSCYEYAVNLLSRHYLIFSALASK